MVAALLSVQQNYLQQARHEYRAAHEQEDDQAGQPLFSDAQEARLLPRGRALRLQLQAVDVGDGQDSGCHEPRQSHDGAHGQHHTHHQQVQVVPTAFLCDKERYQGQAREVGALELTSGRRNYWRVVQLTGFFASTHQQFVFFPVDDDCSYLLVHKDQDGAEKSWNGGGEHRPPGVGTNWVDEPPSVVSGWLVERGHRFHGEYVKSLRTNQVLFWGEKNRTAVFPDFVSLEIWRCKMAAK